MPQFPSLKRRLFLLHLNKELWGQKVPYVQVNTLGSLEQKFLLKSGVILVCSFPAILDI